MTTTAAPRPATSNPSTLFGPDTIARYLEGAPPESEQFAFFVGRWDCALEIHSPDGGDTASLRAVWDARCVHGGRMIIDDIGIRLPTGEEVSAWVNIRTFSPQSGYWEIVGLQALSVVNPVRTIGWWADGALHESFEVPGEDGRVAHRVRFHDIRDDGFRYVWEIEHAAGWWTFATLEATRARETA